MEIYKQFFSEASTMWLTYQLFRYDDGNLYWSWLISAGEDGCEKPLPDVLQSNKTVRNGGVDVPYEDDPL